MITCNMIDSIVYELCRMKKGKDDVSKTTGLECTKKKTLLEKREKGKDP